MLCTTLEREQALLELVKKAPHRHALDGQELEVREDPATGEPLHVLVYTWYGGSVRVEWHLGRVMRLYPPTEATAICETPPLEIAAFRHNLLGALEEAAHLRRQALYGIGGTY